MTDSTDTVLAPRPPRIAIMGEFSAGKSTLCNLLMNARALPEKVTATRLAPVWMTHGEGPHMRVLLDGSEEPVDLDRLTDVPVDDTLYIRVCLEEEMLEHCDIIDFPGISDPNMDPDVWARLLDEADAVLWLTHATQAWRQSEAAVWDIVPANIQARSLLLITRWDKLTNEIDQSRVLKRLDREAGGLFKDVLPISLTDAMSARDDFDAWDRCGASALMDRMVELITDLNTPEADPVQRQAPVLHTVDGEAIAPAPEPVAAAPSIAPVAVGRVGPERPEPEESDLPRVMPRRVRPADSARRARPSGSQAFGY